MTAANLMGLSLIDKTWNDAIEAAAVDCEREAYSLRAMGAEDQEWPWDCARRFDVEAARIRLLKRVNPAQKQA